MKKVYIAGDGLKKGNQILRGMERDAINELGTVALYNPWDQKDINDKSKAPTAEAIFKKDTDAILKSNIIVVDVDNNSVGTTAETGQVWGINFMLLKLQEIVVNANTSDDILEGLVNLINEIPFKQVHWQTTDVRDTDIPESGHRRSHSLNQYLYGMMLDMAGEAKSFDEILGELK